MTMETPVMVHEMIYFENFSSTVHGMILLWALPLLASHVSERMSGYRCYSKPEEIRLARSWKHGVNIEQHKWLKSSISAQHCIHMFSSFLHRLPGLVNIQKAIERGHETGDLPLENHMILHFVINIVECYFARGYIYYIYIHVYLYTIPKYAYNYTIL